MKKVLSRLGKACVEVLIREVSEQGVSWCLKQVKLYVVETIEKGRQVALIK